MPNDRTSMLIPPTLRQEVLHTMTASRLPPGYTGAVRQDGLQLHMRFRDTAQRAAVMSMMGRLGLRNVSEAIQIALDGWVEFYLEKLGPMEVKVMDNPFPDEQPDDDIERLIESTLDIQYVNADFVRCYQCQKARAVHETPSGPLCAGCKRMVYGDAEVDAPVEAEVAAEAELSQPHCPDCGCVLGLNDGYYWHNGNSMFDCPSGSAAFAKDGVVWRRDV